MKFVLCMSSSLQQLGLEHHANVQYMRFTMGKGPYTISYLLTMINDCQLSCMHQEQSHTSCNNYSWQILTSTLKPWHSVNLIAHFNVQAILI